MPYVNGFQPFLSGDFQVQTYLVQRPIQGCLKLFGSLGERWPWYLPSPVQHSNFYSSQQIFFLKNQQYCTKDVAAPNK